MQIILEISIIGSNLIWLKIWLLILLLYIIIIIYLLSKYVFIRTPQLSITKGGFYPPGLADTGVVISHIRLVFFKTYGPNIYILTSFIRFWLWEVQYTALYKSFYGLESLIWSWAWIWSWIHRIFKIQFGINIKENQNLRLLTFLAVPCFGFNHVPSNVDTRCWFIIFASSLSTFRIRFGTKTS